MNVSILVATYGEQRWAELAWRRAIPSATSQHSPAPAEASHVHDPAFLHLARNRAGHEARGDWLLFLDADDELEPGYLTAMAAAVGTCPFMDPCCPCQDGDACHYVSLPGSPAWAAPPPKLLVPAVRYVHADGSAEEPRIPARDRKLIDVNRAVIGTLIQRRLFEAVGGFRDWEMYEDWDLWLRAVCAGAELVEVPAAIYRAHVSPRSRNRAARGRRERAYWAIRAEHEHCAGGV